MKNNIKYRSHCPITYALDILGDRWSLLIIRDMIFKTKKYYGDFSSSAEGISSNILADRLTKLESCGLISKTEDEKNRTRIVYSLTQKGKDLLPMLLEMILWAAKYDEETEAPRSTIKRIKKDPGEFSREVLSKL